MPTGNHTTCTKTRCRNTKKKKLLTGNWKNAQQTLKIIRIDIYNFKSWHSKIWKNVLTVVFLRFFSEWRQVENLAITSTYLWNYNGLVFKHIYLRKPYQICSSDPKLLTHSISSYIEFLNCPPTFWVWPPLKKKVKFLAICTSYFQGMSPS